MDHEFLLHKLWESGLQGAVCNTIKVIYSSPVSCVNINGKLTDWFPARSGVRQGDSLSPILFALFINDLAQEINNSQHGVKIENDYVNLLLYADDIAFIGPNHKATQEMLHIMTRSCRRWGMKVNIQKSQVLHIRNPQR